MQIHLPEKENELAICRHNRAIVEQHLRIRMEVDSASKRRLVRLKRELTIRIRSLGSELRVKEEEVGREIDASYDEEFSTG